MYAFEQVVVMDRGLMDVQAYLNADQWKTILDANNMTEEMMVERLVAIGSKNKLQHHQHRRA